MDVVWIIGSNF